MRKIMILCNSLSGLFQFREELLESLLKKEYNIIVVAPEDDEYTKTLMKLGINCIILKFESRGTNPFKDFNLIKSYKKIIKENCPDVVLTYTIKPNVYGGFICSKLNIPYLVNITGLGSSLEKKGYLQKISLTLYRIGLKKAKCVFFQNIDNLNFMLRHKIVKNNFKLIPGSGVNLKYYTVLPYPYSNTVRFLFISRIIYEKGIEEYFKCAKYIKSKYPNTEFHILGRCDDEKYLEEINDLQKRNIIIYHGQVKDVREYHKISNCTIHPSFYPEGMSNVLLESCAAGRPIITTKRPGCKEIVDDGVNGYLIECNDTEELKKKVEKFINLSYEEKKKMGLEGRKKVENDFDRNIVIESYLNTIGDI